jgi:aminopeptidase-like protein
MNFLSLCDGQNSLLEIAEHLNLPIWELYEVANLLKSHELIEELDKIT